jgi:endonuclease/exonuclease/phosphatase (EEP) superfamily protein YafD
MLQLRFARPGMTERFSFHLRPWPVSMPSIYRSVLRLALVGLAAALTGCVVVPERQHALVLDIDGSVAQISLRCDESAPAPTGRDGTLDPSAIRLASWNVHKEADPGWAPDLGKLTGEADVLLIQETGVSPEFRAVLEEAGFSWRLASAFEYLGTEYGVLTATRVRPAQACTLRAFEPLLGIPKAMLITQYRLAGRDDTLAVANLHAINFTLDTAAYRAQLEAVADVLADHQGPIVVAGDFNTWNDDRDAAVRALATRLSLVPAVFEADARTRFMGDHIFDRVYARGVEFVAATAWSVTSSDHNPLLVSFRVP